MLENGAYQAWSFGSMLLDDGAVITNFDSRLSQKNPRCAIGYFESGHYCFIVVDGHQQGYSVGMTLSELSQVSYDMGCTAAYNMDGGKSAEMAFMGDLVNQPTDGGRKVSDIVYIAAD